MTWLAGQLARLPFPLPFLVVFVVAVLAVLAAGYAIVGLVVWIGRRRDRRRDLAQLRARAVAPGGYRGTRR
jgi:hypothetical protein